MSRSATELAVGVGQILLNESRAEVDVELHERTVADGREAVHLARLDHQDLAGARFERFAVDDPAAAALLHELNLVVRMTVRTGTGAGLAVKQKHRHVHAAVVRADEVVRAAAERQILASKSQHAYGLSLRLIGVEEIRTAAPADAV